MAGKVSIDSCKGLPRATLGLEGALNERPG